MNLISEHIFLDANEKKKDFNILFMPRISLICVRKLKELGVYANLTTIEEYPVEIFPFDNDLLSLELEDGYKDSKLHCDYTSLFNSAKSLMTIQSIFGIIPTVYGHGKNAKYVYDLIARMRDENPEEYHELPKIDSLLLMDRNADLLTPLVTQLTYEGLIDEIYNIENNNVKLPSEKFKTKDSEKGEGSSSSTSLKSLANPNSKITKMTLNSNEELYAKLRDQNFLAVGSILNQTAKDLAAKEDERHNAKSVSQLKQFVDIIPYLKSARKSLSNQISIAELIKEKIDQEEFRKTLQTEQEFLNCIDTDKINPFIEDCIATEVPLNKVFRLICIQSLVNNGLKSKVLDYYRKEILQTYGFWNLSAFYNLEKCGLLKVAGGFYNRIYPSLRRSFRLTVEKLDEKNPNDIAYVHSIYAPLSVRLAQLLVNPGWRNLPDLFKLLSEPSFEFIQPIPPGLRKRRTSSSSTASGMPEEKRVILIFFIGGCTYAEISALRFLSKQEDCKMIIKYYTIA